MKKGEHASLVNCADTLTKKSRCISDFIDSTILQELTVVKLPIPPSSSCDLVSKRCRVKVPHVDQHDDTENQYDSQNWASLINSAIAEIARTTVTGLPAVMFNEILAICAISIE